MMMNKQKVVEITKTKRSFGSMLKIMVGCFICLILVGSIVALFAFNSSAITVASLNVEEGAVEVNQGAGWVPAEDGMELSLDDMVRTGADGAASVILYESAIITLDPGTEIKLAELSKENSVVQQSSGSTWNKFTKMNGMKGLEVETPNSVATVRGTEFGVDMENVTVMEGEVAATDKLSGKVYSVPAGQKAARLEGKLALGDLSDDERERLLNKMDKNVKRLEHLAEKQANKQSKIEKAIGKKSAKAEKTLEKADESRKEISKKRAERQGDEKPNKKPEITDVGIKSNKGKKD